MYGIGYISRTLADTLQVGNGLGKLPPMLSNYGNAFVIDYVPLSEIYTDESNFQNRGDKYSEKSVKSIIDAVANGSFNWFAFDPVILWENPADGKKYVLSGHSRTQAFRQLAKMHPDWIVDGLTFTSIPARIYRGSFEDAKRLALNSNTLATPETLTERAAYYRRIRERQGITKGKDLKALKDKALRENNGQMIWDLSYLPDGGISFDSLKAFKLGEESGSTENFLRLATICQWIGKAFQIYKGLSKAHDRELFNFLMSGGYGSKSGQYFNFSSLNDRLQKLYTKNVADDRKVNANGEYTEPFQIAAYKKDDATLDTLNELKKDADGAYKDLKRKLKELRDNNATREQIFEVATPYFNGWANALYDWWSLLDRTPKEDTAPSLFGLGRISPEQYFNIDFFQYPERLFDIAETAINNEYVGNAQELDNQLRQMSDLRLLSDYQDSDDELINILRNNIKSDAYQSQTPTKDDVRFTQRKWNRWAHVQKLWGDFIDALALMVVPQDLISRYFKAIIVRPRSNEEKTFPDIAKALDFAFDKGQLNRNSWIILNDRNKAVLTDNDVPKPLNGVLCGIFGVSGLGKPTIKFEFETNSELADFLTKTKDTVDYAETVDSDTYSNPMTVNTRRQSRKAAQQKALTDTPSNYLPPSDGTPSLPPSPTSPKSLPPYVEPQPTTPSPTTTYVEPDSPAYKNKSFDIYQKFKVFVYPPDTRKDDIISYLHKELGYDTIVGMVSNQSANPRKPKYSVHFYDYDAVDVAKILGSKSRKDYYEIDPSRASRELSKIQAQRPLYLWAFRAPLKVVQSQPEPTPTQRKKPEIEFDNIKYITRDMPAIWMNVPKSSITDHWLADWWDFAERKYHYPDDIVTFVQIDEKFNGRFNKKYYQFFFKDRDKNFVMQSVKNPKNVIFRDGGYFIVTTLADIERIEDALLDDGNRHLVIIEPHIYDDETLGKPTIKLEFEDNGELMSLFDTDGISGLTVNDKPAAVFNCAESELNTQGFAPTYQRLDDYSHLIDAADGAKTLKGYGFEKATLDELVNACQNYRQVERLAAHLKDDDEMQSAFNIWHWLHTNVRYNYDAPGEEEIRTPARVWADRESGVDCDCLAVFTACLLICMGYKPKFEIVAFNNSPTFSHIYVNLDGMAIDRVLPVFLARPGNITKTQIMEIPVYSLSGIDGCNTLSGVYTSTLAKVQNGTATGEDLNNLRKTEVLLTLKGLDDDEYKLAKILMPYVVTIGDDGKYYFDNAKLAAVAQKVDAELALLKQQNASPEAMTQWLAKVLDQLDGVSVNAQTPSDEDTIVVIINPKGCPCHVTGPFVSADLQTLTPDSSAASTAAATASPSADSPLYATTPAPIATPPDAESETSNTWLWIAGISAAFGIGAALASGSGKKKRR
jgi:hypothetical protein